MLNGESSMSKQLIKRASETADKLHDLVPLDPDTPIVDKMGIIGESYEAIRDLCWALENEIERNSWAHEVLLRHSTIK